MYVLFRLQPGALELEKLFRLCHDLFVELLNQNLKKVCTNLAALTLHYISW